MKTKKEPDPAKPVFPLMVKIAEREKSIQAKLKDDYEEYKKLRSMKISLGQIYNGTGPSSQIRNHLNRDTKKWIDDLSWLAQHIIWKIKYQVPNQNKPIRSLVFTQQFGQENKKKALQISAMILFYVKEFKRRVKNASEFFNERRQHDMATMYLKSAMSTWEQVEKCLYDLVSVIIAIEVELHNMIDSGEVVLIWPKDKKDILDEIAIELTRGKDKSKAVRAVINRHPKLDIALHFNAIRAEYNRSIATKKKRR